MPDISIITTTYNSEKFIDRTITYMMEQQISGYSIELILSDDASTDRTVKLLRKAQEEAPFPINIIEHPQNIGVVRNFFGAAHTATGKYLAICDADDFWLDPQKLSKQIKYMESNPACALTYHDVAKVNSEDVGKIASRNFNQLAIQKTPHTSTLMVRSNAIDYPWPLINQMTRMNDQLLRFRVSLHGKLVYLPHIRPTVRVVRSHSVFASPRSELVRRKSSLHNWTLIYNYYKQSPERDQLRRRVDGFQSSVNWLEYSKTENLKNFIGCVWFDVRSGVAFRRMKRKIMSALSRVAFKLIGTRDANRSHLT